MNRIELTNFRVFKEATAFDLSPITILTGKNNSGKSSLIKSFLLLADYFDSSTNQRFLDLNGLLALKHKLPDFSKVRNWSPHSPLFTTFKFQIDDCRFLLTFGGEKDTLSPQLQEFRFDYQNLNEGLHLERTVEGFYLQVSQRFILAFISTIEPISKSDYDVDIERLEGLSAELRILREQLRQIRSEKGDIPSQQQLIFLIEREQQLDLQQKRLEQQIRELENRPNYDSIIYQVDIPFQDDEDSVLSIPNIIRQGLSRYVYDQQKDTKGSFRYTSGDERQFSRFADRLRRKLTLTVAHLSPNRTHQARLYYAHDQQTEINAIINEYAHLKIPKGSTAGIFLKRWLGENKEGIGFGLGEDVKVTSVKGEASTIELIQGGKPIDLADMGFGTGQLLTMLLKIASIIHKNYDNKILRTRLSERIILIEEPESNLHPNLQSRLAEMILEAASTYNIQFILETHSEYLIREVQALVKEINSGERILRQSASRYQQQSLLNKSDLHPFKIYYFDDKKGPYEMRFRDDGKFIDEFGPGFFNESRRLAFKIL